MHEKYNFLKIQKTFKVKNKKTQCYAICQICGKDYYGTLATVKFNHTVSCGCLSNIRRKFSKDIIYDYFDDLNSEAVNYWGGFLFGDGCIDKKNSLKICLTSNNNSPDFLRKLSQFIFNKDNVRIYENQTRCLLGVNNCKEINENLKKFGIIYNKTYKGILKIPNKKMASHVIRGYFDADGWFSKRNDGYNSYILGLCSYLKENLEVVVSYLPFECKIRKYSNKNLYYISIAKQKSILDFINYFEPIDKNLCFNYKWDKLWSFKQLMLNDWKK